MRTFFVRTMELSDEFITVRVYSILINTYLINHLLTELIYLKKKTPSSFEFRYSETR